MLQCCTKPHLKIEQIKVSFLIDKRVDQHQHNWTHSKNHSDLFYNSAWWWSNMQTESQCFDLTHTAQNHHEQFTAQLQQTFCYFYKFRFFFWTQNEQLVQLISDCFPFRAEISDIMLLSVWLQCVWRGIIRNHPSGPRLHSRLSHHREDVCGWVKLWNTHTHARALTLLRSVCSSVWRCFFLFFYCLNVTSALDFVQFFRQHNKLNLLSLLSYWHNITDVT